MHTEHGFLQTAFEREEAERIRRELSASPDSFFSDCRKGVDCATTAACDAVRKGDSVLSRCDGERRKWMAELETAIDALPSAQSVFRSALSDRELFEICRRLPRLELRMRDMEAVCAPFSKVLDEMREAEGRVLSARAPIAQGVCVCADAELQHALCDLRDRLDDAAKELAEGRLTLRGRRDAWFSFCMEQVPRFLKELRQAADLANGGKACDLATLRRVMGQMRHCSERVFDRMSVKKTDF